MEQVSNHSTISPYSRTEGAEWPSNQEHCCDYGYMTLVEELRQRYRARETTTSRLIETRDRRGILARGADIRQAYLERLTNPLLPEESLEAETVGVLEFPDYTIEKIVLQGKEALSIPGNLYLPRHREAKCPAAIVLSGHWLHAKAMEAHQRFCANLAIRGIAAFAYDPLYQGERCPYAPAELEAMFGPITEDMWMVNLHMLGGNLAYLLGGNIGALFLWEARRVLDCLCARPEIDIQRVAAVGQSGGGTQACYLAALDSRISLYAPVQCLSQLAITLEDGIGDCEQSLYGISRDQGVEQWDILWAALPKPVLHSAARQDFFSLEGAYAVAREMQGVYRVLGHKEDYTLEVADCGHEFSQEARCHVYGWLTERFFGKRDGTEYPMEVLPPEALHCLDGPPEKGPEQLYARQLRLLRERRPVEDEAVLAALEALLGSMERYTIEMLSETDTELTFCVHVPYNESALCRLRRKESPCLRIIVSQEAPAESEEVSTLQVIPWAIESACRKQRGGYDMETCLFNASAVLGRNLAIQRVIQIRAAADYAIQVTGASHVSALGVGACALPLLLASCTDSRLRPLALACCQISWEDFFRERKYFLQETSIVPGLLEIADLPRLCSLSDATVFNPLRADGQPYTREEVRREERVSCIWKADLSTALEH